MYLSLVCVREWLCIVPVLLVLSEVVPEAVEYGTFIWFRLDIRLRMVCGNWHVLDAQTGQRVVKILYHELCDIIRQESTRYAVHMWSVL